MMNSKPNRLSRRTLLRGLGCAVALPWLESMGPMVNWARGAVTPAGKAASGGCGRPLAPIVSLVSA